jgi:hypothetical protein
VASVDEKDPFLTTYFLDSHPAPLERLARIKLVAQYFKAGRAAEVFLQTADLNRRPPPPLSGTVGEAPLSQPPAPPASAVRGHAPLPVSSNRRDRDGHPGPAGSAVYPNLGLIGGQEPPRHKQPQAGPVTVGSPLGGEEGIEDPG